MRRMFDSANVLVMRLSLSEWESFYVITGTAGAALTGLMFVVIALAADRGERTPADGVGAFSTPTVTHFSIALLLAGIMTMPVHTVLSLGASLGGCVVFGLLSTSLAGMRMRRLDVYSPGADDWTWHVILPVVAYAALGVTALKLPAAPKLALVGPAAVSLFLLFIGIHNAWDVAVFLVVRRSERQVREPAAELPAPASGLAPATVSAQANVRAADPVPPKQL